MMDTIIRASALAKCYPSGEGKTFYALRGIDLAIGRGQLVILKGRSGSGKTTLLNLLGALDEPTSGEVECFGRKLSGLTAGEREDMRRQQMGFVFQSIALIPAMSAYENLDFALRLAGVRNRDRRIRECLKRVGLSGRMDHRAGELSGGEQQRVAIARAAVHSPRVIFADEPTGALDTASGLSVMKLFRELVEAEHVTILMTTHDPNLMELGDLVYELRDGELTRADGEQIDGASPQGTKRE